MTATADVNQWHYIHLESFRTAKDAVKKTGRQPTGWERLLHVMSDEGSVSKIYKELPQLRSRQPHNGVKKRAEELNKHFPKEDVWTPNRHVTRCSASLIIKETQTTVRCRPTLVRATVVEKVRGNRCRRRYAERVALGGVAGDADGAAALEDSVAVPQNERPGLSHHLAVPLLGFYPKE